MPRRLKLSILLAFCLHGIFILSARYRFSYDAFNHMFFADHYLRDWWSIWEPRWYTGFEIVSYPPLVHQLNALLGHLIGVDAAYGLLLCVTLTAYPLGVYCFSRIFTGRAAASYAALGAALLPSLFLSAHVFGQLPTLVSTLLLLFGTAVMADFLRHGDMLSGAVAVLTYATAMAAHHATLLFQPWLAGSVFLVLMLDQTTGRRRLIFRFVGFTALTALASLVVIWPFWLWGSYQSLQTPIDHLSRHNFLADPRAIGLFFLPVYGVLIPFIPFGVWMGLRRRYWGWVIAFLFLFFLGLGGTTPLPRLLFGASWEWLTYDRFALWASILLLPLFGMLVVWLRRFRSSRRVWPVFVGLLGFVALITGFIPTLLPTQPLPVDMQPIVDFLARAGHARYRYVTLGFGDQLAYLSRLTDATTIDGSYHTARGLPELRTSGIGQIDTAFWIPGGMSALESILQISGERGVRWGLVNLHFYQPLLRQIGWVKLTRLSNGIEVWENPAAIPPPGVQPPADSPITSFSWGTLPMLALFLTGALALRRYGTFASQRIFSAAEAFAIGLLPVSLTLWYYRTLFVIVQPRIYFTYTDALFFLSDGLALLAVLIWLVRRWPAPGDPGRIGEPFSLRRYFARPVGWLLAICLLATFSVFWALDWRTSLYVSLQLWLCFGLYLVLRDSPEALAWFAAGCCAALVIQFVVAGGEYVTQSTTLVAPLGMKWPGELLPWMRGASVVQLLDGARWLRAYGTFPHPNILGGFSLALLAPPLALFLRPGKRPVLGVILFTLGLLLVGLSFSRSAWLGLLVLGAGLFVSWKRLDHKGLILIGLIGLATIVLLALALKPLFVVRLGQPQVQTEQVSNFTRQWLVERTLELIRENPITGTGIGSFSLALSRHVAAFYEIEPVHNVGLLVTAEVGIGGMVLLGGFVIVTGFQALKVHSPEATVLSLALLALAVVGLFDHYLWTLAPGRLLLAATLGLWAGQVKVDEHPG